MGLRFSSSSQPHSVPLLSSHVPIPEKPNLKEFTFEDLKSATKNFKNWIGETESVYNRVYKGCLDENTLTPSKPPSGTLFAVKRLQLHTFQECQAEASFLERFSHPNVVKLLGYCRADSEFEFLLVHEFMSKGSLDIHLFTRNPNTEPLSWNTRLKIAIGAARGLTFLHNSGRPVIYRDFTSSDILLDRNFNAKISDFCLVDKLRPSEGDTNFCMWYSLDPCGFTAPECLEKGKVYVKSGVYGFGVVLLEILTGMPSFDLNRPTKQLKLSEWTKPLLSSEKKLKTIMDAKMEGQYSPKAAFQVAQLALKCLNHDHKQRPSMKEVLEALEAITTTIYEE